MKKTLALFLVISVIFSLSACGKRTPIDELTESELILFDALKIMTKDFFEPGEVKLLEVGDYGVSNENPFEIDYLAEEFDEEYDWDAYIAYEQFLDEVHDDLGYGEFKYITVRIQGENRVGGTLNHYYRIRLDTLPESIVDNPAQFAEEEFSKYHNKQEDWDNDEYNRRWHDSWEEYKSYTINLLYKDAYCDQEYATEHMGKYSELESYFSIETSAEDTYNIAKINRALKYYWDERLGND